MRILLAPDSFKGTASALEVAQHLADGIREVAPDAEVRLMPLADGGEGTAAALAHAYPGSCFEPVEVRGPDGRAHRGEWLRAATEQGGTLGVVELAGNSGIELLRGALRPWDADSRGFGDAIAAAIDGGSRSLILAIGSSASTDGGLGMLTALGARFLNADGDPVDPGARGLAQLARIDVSALRPLPAGGVTVLSDVTAPLTGTGGAAHVFGPQKGLTPADVERVDHAMGRYAALLSEALGIPHAPETPAAGAAGGVGFALHAWGARLASGAEIIAEKTGLRAAIAQAGLVVTGEGRFDAQSAIGKIPGLVNSIARAERVPVGVVAGAIHSAAPREGLAQLISLSELAGDPQAAMRDTARWLIEAGRRLATSSVPSPTAP